MNSGESMSFSKDVQKQLGHYVYALVDPRDETIFYVGKASANNRAFNHLKSSKDETGGKGSKNHLIAEIRSFELEPRVDIIRHGLIDEQTAFEVEAAVIDALGLENLTNEVLGHNIIRGRQTSDTLIRRYGAEAISVTELETNVIVFYLNGTYHPSLSEQALYDATRQYWGVSLERANSKYEDGSLVYPIALAVVDSIVVGVFDIVQWFPAGTTYSSRSSKVRNTDEPEKKTKAEFIGMPNHNSPLLQKKLLDVDNTPLVAKQNGFQYFDVY